MIYVTSFTSSPLFIHRTRAVDREIGLALSSNNHILLQNDDDNDDNDDNDDEVCIRRRRVMKRADDTRRRQPRSRSGSYARRRDSSRRGGDDESGFITNMLWNSAIVASEAYNVFMDALSIPNKGGVFDDDYSSFSSTSSYVSKEVDSVTNEMLLEQKMRTRRMEKRRKKFDAVSSPENIENNDKSQGNDPFEDTESRNHLIDSKMSTKNEVVIDVSRGQDDVKSEGERLIPDFESSHDVSSPNESPPEKVSKNPSRRRRVRSSTNGRYNSPRRKKIKRANEMEFVVPIPSVHGVGDTIDRVWNSDNNILRDVIESSSEAIAVNALNIGEYKNYISTFNDRLENGEQQNRENQEGIEENDLDQDGSLVNILFRNGSFKTSGKASNMCSSFVQTFARTVIILLASLLEWASCRGALPRPVVVGALSISTFFAPKQKMRITLTFSLIAIRVLAEGMYGLIHRDGDRHSREGDKSENDSSRHKRYYQIKGDGQATYNDSK